MKSSSTPGAASVRLAAVVVTATTATAMLLLASGCGARSQLGVGQTASDAAATTCPVFPAVIGTVKHGVGEACAFATNASSYPVLAAIAGQELFVLSSQGLVTNVFSFGGTGNVARRIVSRGEYIGAIVVSQAAPSQLDAELLLLRTDGTVLVDDHEAGSGSDSYGVTGNAGGTFAFSAFGKVWLAAQATLLPPVEAASLSFQNVDPDAQGRVLVLPSPTNSSAAFEWLDPCARTLTPVQLRTGHGMSPWRGGLFGLTDTGQPSIETATNGVIAMPTPSLPPQGTYLWDFTAPGVAMINVPDAINPNVHLVTLDVTTATPHMVTLPTAGTPGLQMVGGGAFLSEVGDSNDPAGFGVDSAGRVTMFLSDTSGTIRLYATTNGSDWTAVSGALMDDPSFDPNYSLRYAEAGGTFAIQSVVPMQGFTWDVIRQASGVDVRIAGKGLLAADGGCVAALVGPTELDVVQATTGTVTPITLPSPVSMAASDWVSTWVGDDDALFVDY